MSTGSRLSHFAFNWSGDRFDDWSFDDLVKGGVNPRIKDLHSIGRFWTNDWNVGILVRSIRPVSINKWAYGLAGFNHSLFEEKYSSSILVIIVFIAGWLWVSGNPEIEWSRNTAPDESHPRELIRSRACDNSVDETFSTLPDFVTQSLKKVARRRYESS